MTDTSVDKYHRRQAQQMNQMELGRNILWLVHTLSGMAIHIRPAKTEKGWRTPGEGDIENYPDWTIFLPLQGRCIWAELTMVGKKPTPGQIAYGEAIIKAGGEWYWWTPEQWFSGEIERILAGGG